MGLYRRGRAPHREGLDDIRVERALHEQGRVPAGFARRPFEHPDEDLADDAALALGIIDSGQPVQELLARVGDQQLHPHVPAEGALHTLVFALPEQPVVHEDAGEAVAERPVHQRGRDRGVDPAGEAADGGPASRLLADGGDALVDERARRPARTAAGDAEEKVGEHPVALGGVCDLRMKLHPVDGSVLGPERRHREALGGSDDTIPFRRLVHMVAVGTPDRDGIFAREPREQALRFAQAQLGSPVLALAVLHPSALQPGDQLHAVADPQHRNVHVQELGLQPRAIVLVDRGWPAREHDRAGRPAANPLQGPGRRVDLAEDPFLADAARDELGELRSVVEDEDPVARAGEGHDGILSPRTRSAKVSRSRIRRSPPSATSTSAGRRRLL